MECITGTAEEANRIGYELASRFLKDKHAFIVATHTDREHIHNHIIYNSTTLDGTRKFRDFFFSGLAVQRLSDIICLEHQLSVIEKKPYRERQKRITYKHRGAEPEIQHSDADKEAGTPSVDAEAAAALTKLLSDPSMAALIKNLAKSL